MQRMHQHCSTHARTHMNLLAVVNRPKNLIGMHFVKRATAHTISQEIATAANLFKSL